MVFYTLAFFSSNNSFIFLLGFCCLLPRLSLKLQYFLNPLILYSHPRFWEYHNRTFLTLHLIDREHYNFSDVSILDVSIQRNQYAANFKFFLQKRSLERYPKSHYWKFGLIFDSTITSWGGSVIKIWAWFPSMKRFVIIMFLFFRF